MGGRNLTGKNFGQPVRILFQVWYHTAALETIFDLTIKLRRAAFDGCLSMPKLPPEPCFSSPANPSTHGRQRHEPHSRRELLASLYVWLAG